jgi:hypothetical protein
MFPGWGTSTLIVRSAPVEAGVLVETDTDSMGDELG